MVVVGQAEVAGPEQPENGLRRHGGHEATLVVQPLRITLLGDAVADENEARGAQGDQLVGIDGQLLRRPAGVLALSRVRKAPEKLKAA